MDPSVVLQLPTRGFPELSDTVRRELESLLRSREIANRGTSPQGSPDCLFATIEAYISLVLCLLPKLADRLARGSLISDYINTQMAEIEDATDFSDLTPITHLCEKQQRLRLLVTRLQSLVDAFNDSPAMSSSSQAPPIEAQTARSPAPPQTFSSYSASPFSGSAPSVSGRLVVTPQAIPSRSTPDIPGSPAIFTPSLERLQGFNSTRQDSVFPIMASEQPSSEQPSNSTGRIDTNQLDHRGKGRHTCPHELQCTKGGVNADGTLVIFERNSAFRAHLQKHDRPYKCDLPGCTNRSGFARIDQLNRHKATTRHG